MTGAEKLPNFVEACPELIEEPEMVNELLARPPAPVIPVPLVMLPMETPPGNEYEGAVITPVDGMFVGVCMSAFSVVDLAER